MSAASQNRNVSIQSISDPGSGSVSIKDHCFRICFWCWFCFLRLVSRTFWRIFHSGWIFFSKGSENSDHFQQLHTTPHSNPTDTTTLVSYHYHHGRLWFDWYQNRVGFVVLDLFFCTIGLAVMGENLVLNIESRGFTVAVFNRTTSKVDEFVNGRGKGKKVIGCHSLEQLCKSLKTPRKVMMMVRAGDAVDETINHLLPYLEKGDIVIDGGNSHFPGKFCM